MTDSRQSFLVGMLLGGVAGAIAALLYAPQEGGETREQVKEKARQARGRASEVVGSVKESADHAKTRGKDYLRTKKEQLKAAVEAGKQAAAEKEAELKSEAGESGEPKASV